MKEFTIYLTLKCNFMCHYCYEKYNNFYDENKVTDMSIEMLDSVLNYIINNTNDNEVVMIGFLGGEPLLKSELIVYTVKFLDQHGGNRNFKYKITTNGSIITDSLIDIFTEKKFNISISLDGDEKCNNRNRISCNGINYYPFIINKAQSLLKQNCNVTIRMTVAINNIPHMYENFLFFYNMGFKKIFLFFDSTAAFNNIDYTNIQNEMEKFSKFYLESTDDELIVNLLNYTHQFLIFDTPKGFGICNGGKTNFKIMPSGNIYPCSAVIGDEYFIIGNVRYGRSKKISDIILNRNMILSTPKNRCNIDNCSICGFCNAIKCGYINYTETGYMNYCSNIRCTQQKILYEINHKIVETMLQNNDSRLTKYFDFAKSKDINLSPLAMQYHNMEEL